ASPGLPAGPLRARDCAPPGSPASAGARSWRRPQRSPGMEEAQTREDPVAVGQVADDPPQRLRLELDQGRGGDDLQIARLLRVGVDVDHFQIETVGQKLLA